MKFYSNKKLAEDAYKKLWKEYRIIEEILLGELDETVIMGRTPEGEVINAFLKHGMVPEFREDFDTQIERPTMRSRLTDDRRIRQEVR